jgi:hypothetical protein
MPKSNIDDLVRHDCDDVIKLNTYYNKIAIQQIYLSIFEKVVKLSDIHISDRESLLKIGKKPILRWDRHHHLPDKKYVIYANYLWLKSVEDTLLNMNRLKL